MSDDEAILADVDRRCQDLRIHMRVLGGLIETPKEESLALEYLDKIYDWTLSDFSRTETIWR